MQLFIVCIVRTYVRKLDKIYVSVRIQRTLHQIGWLASLALEDRLAMYVPLG